MSPINLLVDILSIGPSDGVEYRGQTSQTAPSARFFWIARKSDVIASSPSTRMASFLQPHRRKLSAIEPMTNWMGPFFSTEMAATTTSWVWCKTIAM